MTLADAIRKAKRVYIVGNGGSAANASHMANDLLAAGVRAYALTDQAIVSAVANDHGWDNVFSAQLHVYGEEGDLLIAMSGSGKSQNVLNAIAEASTKGMEVFKIFGNERDENMQQSEEAQIKLGHEARRCLR